MNSYNYENFPDGPWEDRGGLPWTEFDWQEYLKRNEKEIARFLALFHKHKQQPDHLDRIAHLMGWDDEHWAPAEGAAPTPAPEAATPPAADKKTAAHPTPHPVPVEPEVDEADADTYTIHKHPVFIATRALYQHLYLTWEHFLSVGHELLVTPSVAWKFAASLHAGELNAVMAIQALDLGDFTLAICHLKNALSAVNHSLSMLQMLPLTNTAYHVQFFREGQTALFDLREIWLRVMNDCREEHRRRGLGEPDAQE